MNAVPGAMPAGVPGQGGFGAPQGGFGAPQGGFGAPQGGFGAPQGGFGAPQGGFGAPQGQLGGSSNTGGSSEVLTKIGSTVGFIILLIIINLITYNACGYIVY